MVSKPESEPGKPFNPASIRSLSGLLKMSTNAAI
jgi:hypothetical protein